MVITALKRTVPFNIASGKLGQFWEDSDLGRITECIVGLGQRESFDHAVNLLELGEFDRLFRIESMPTGPGLHRKPVAKLVYRQSKKCCDL